MKDQSGQENAICADLSASREADMGKLTCFGS